MAGPGKICLRGVGGSGYPALYLGVYSLRIDYAAVWSSMRLAGLHRNHSNKEGLHSVSVVLGFLTTGALLDNGHSFMHDRKSFSGCRFRYVFTIPE